MARWKLTDKHYLYTDPPTEWEQVETDLGTGEQTRVKHIVPKLLNPDEPRHLNKDGELVVCLKGKGQRGDVVFTGMPTKFMLPLDEEAQEISDAMQHGEDPIESLPAQGDLPKGQLQIMQAQINALMLANDELHKRLAKSDGDAEADIAAHTAQAPKVLKPATPQPARRI